MPLDPQARVFLDQLAAMGAPPMTESTPQDARAAMTMMSALGGQPEQRAATEDRAIPGPGGDIPVRIYRPESQGPLPAVVYFHGGGFVIGSIETHDGVCHQLATRVPAVVVNVDYRLAPEHRFPAAVDDAWAAAQWVSSHAAELGVERPEVPRLRPVSYDADLDAGDSRAEDRGGLQEIPEALARVHPCDREYRRPARRAPPGGREPPAPLGEVQRLGHDGDLPRRIPRGRAVPDELVPSLGAAPGQWRRQGRHPRLPRAVRRRYAVVPGPGRRHCRRPPAG